MTAPQRTPRRRPLVAVVCTAALVFEGIAVAVDELAEVLPVNADTNQVAGLLRSLDPDAVVVDSAVHAADLAPLTRELGVPLVHVGLQDGRLRVFDGGSWSEDVVGETGLEAIRNATASVLYARRPA